MSGGGRTGNADLIEMATRFGAKEILAKPFERLDLIDAVCRALSPDEDFGHRPASGAQRPTTGSKAPGRQPLRGSVAFLHLGRRPAETIWCRCDPLWIW